MSIAEQLQDAGIDLDAEAAVRLTFGVRCDSDQACRYSRVLLPRLEDAQAVADDHEAAWPGHRCTVTVSATMPVDGRPRE